MNDKDIKEFKDLSAIVQADGYMALDSNEKRVRYRELKKQMEDDTVPLEGVTKAYLKTLMEEAVEEYKREMGKTLKNEEGMEEALKFGQWIKNKTPKNRNHTARLRLYREDGTAEAGVVIDMKFKKNLFNEATRKHDDPLYEITVLYDNGEEKKVDMRLLDYNAINEFETVEILDKEVQELAMSQGKGRRAVTKNGYNFSNPGMFGTKSAGMGEEFDYVVTKTDVVMHIKRPNGSTLKINASKLNQ